MLDASVRMVDDKMMKQLWGAYMIEYIAEQNVTPKSWERLVALSVKFGLANRFTSFLCVDMGESIKNHQDMVTEYVPHFQNDLDLDVLGHITRCKLPLGYFSEQSECLLVPERASRSSTPSLMRKARRVVGAVVNAVSAKAKRIKFGFNSKAPSDTSDEEMEEMNVVKKGDGEGDGERDEGKDEEDVIMDDVVVAKPKLLKHGGFMLKHKLANGSFDLNAESMEDFEISEEKLDEVMKDKSVNRMIAFNMLVFNVLSELVKNGKAEYELIVENLGRWIDENK